MKKIILSLVSVGMISTAANAQLAIAPELGLNLANMAFKYAGVTDNTTSMKAGLAIGAVIDFGLTDNIYLQPGLFYLMNGCNGTGGTSYNLNTIQIPVNFEYKTGKEGGNRFFFGVGPYLAYNISGTFKDATTSTAVNIG